MCLPHDTERLSMTDGALSSPSDSVLAPHPCPHQTLCLVGPWVAGQVVALCTDCSAVVVLSLTGGSPKPHQAQQRTHLRTADGTLACGRTPTPHWAVALTLEATTCRRCHQSMVVRVMQILEGQHETHGGG